MGWRGGAESLVGERRTVGPLSDGLGRVEDRPRRALRAAGLERRPQSASGMWAHKVGGVEDFHSIHRSLCTLGAAGPCGGRRRGAGPLRL